MSHVPALSTREGGEISAGNISSSLSLIDVLYANQFEGQTFHQDVLDETEENFYRGAPPVWLNFHISDQAGGTGTPFIKRDGYNELVTQICNMRKHPGSIIRMFHQPGCGGSTLAMNVLWDLRKTFRSAVLKDSESDILDFAKEVVCLFTAGAQHRQNTVLLLVNGELFLEKMQEVVRKKMAMFEIETQMCVLIILNCVRKDVIPAGEISLTKQLSRTEMQNFKKKNNELQEKYGDKCRHFHGFNIMLTNFSQTYVQEACSVFKSINIKIELQKIRLAALLSLLNSYVPNSYLLESQCLHFFRCNSRDVQLKDIMQPFSHLIVTIRQRNTLERKVFMAHRMIAQCCTELLAKAKGLTRSDVAKNFLSCFCKDYVPEFLYWFVKDMLTKRERKADGKQEHFSRLILDIQLHEKNEESATVLKMASNLLEKFPFFPQALARFLCKEMQQYNIAEIWAETAMKRHPQNSFITDTLGQVYKNYLQSICSPANLTRVLTLASKAIEAFRNAERLAEVEFNGERKGKVKMTATYNTFGKTGYLQVCSNLYRLLTRHNIIWHEVLRNEVPLVSVLKSLGDDSLYRFYDVIISLRGDIQEDCVFLNTYLTYSRPDVSNNDLQYIFDTVSHCRHIYAIDFPSKQFKQKGTALIMELKRRLVDTSAAVLQCFDRCSYKEHEEAIIWWTEIFWSSSVKSLVDNIIAPTASRDMEAMMRIPCTLSLDDPPELHMLTLLLCWPTSAEDECFPDLRRLLSMMRCSYARTYKKYFKSRYLHPLFFIGHGQHLKRIVLNKENQPPPLKFKGVVRNYRLFATIGDTEIEVNVDAKSRPWRGGQGTFYLGFNIKGPVAYKLQMKSTGRGAEKRKALRADSPKPGVITEGQSFVDRHRTALINRVSDTEFILKKLKSGQWISNEDYGAMMTLEDPKDQMSRILQSLTSEGKDAFYGILRRMKTMRPLIAELQESE